jgi:hypothetical protein
MTLELLHRREVPWAVAVLAKDEAASITACLSSIAHEFGRKTGA